MGLSSKDVLHKAALNSDAISVMSPKERTKLQDLLTSMLKDIQKACSLMGVEIVLCGGSCLGAVRHQGFIPWDDDMDISMFREDWDLFKTRFDELLGGKYVLEAPNYNDKDSKYPWSKIYLKGTEYVEVFDINYPYNKGISIDVFVIENVHRLRFVQYFDASIAALFKYVATSMLFYKYPNDLMKQMFSHTFKSKMYFDSRRLLGWFFSCVSHKKWLEWYDKFISRHKEASMMVTIPTGTRLYLGEMLNRNIWLPFSKGVFNGVKVNLPKNPDLYCKNLYGNNYMQIPPVEKREPHPIVKLSFQNE